MPTSSARAWARAMPARVLWSVTPIAGRPSALAASEQLLDVARAAQEGVVRGDLQLDVAGTGGARHPAQSLFGCRCPLVDGAMAAGRRIRTYPERSRCCTSRSAVTRAITSSAECTRYLPA